MNNWEGNPKTQVAGQLRPAYRAFLDQFDSCYGEWRKNNEKLAIIVDNRHDDVVIPRVIGNFRHFLGDTWNIRWLQPPINEPFGTKQLNAMLLSRDFWEEKKEEHILIFQRDTICCKPLDPDFLEYDFVGAPCGPLQLMGGYIVGFDMNGGLSLRRRSAMIKALEDGPPRGMPEDVFFTRRLRQLSPRLEARVPCFDIAARFSVETEACYREQPFGVHGTDKFYMTDEMVTKIIDRVNVSVNV